VKIERHMSARQAFKDGCSSWEGIFDRRHFGVGLARSAPRVLPAMAIRWRPFRICSVGSARSIRDQQWLKLVAVGKDHAFKKEVD